jgi:6-phospho-beta-glucosidase
LKDAVKIAVIGGGSSYTPEIVEGLILRYHEMPLRDSLEKWLFRILEYILQSFLAKK